MSINEKINAFIGDIPNLKKSRNTTMNKIWVGQVREFLNQLNLSGTDIYQMNTTLNILENYTYEDAYYDNADLFLKLLYRKGLSAKEKDIPKTITSTTIQPVPPLNNALLEFLKSEKESERGKPIPIIEKTKSVISSTKTNKIFIVHGHDDKSKLELARILEKMGLETVILHEQPNQGKTIMEKFEEYSKDVNFAFVLLTPDDLGGKDKNNLNNRARQNVILELGFFIAKLGRSRVCGLHKKEVELPTDYLGVTYLPFTDSPKECYEEIIRELRTAGYNLKI
jgi:predicted nucleotide-binding protein